MIDGIHKKSIEAAVKENTFLYNPPDRGLVKKYRSKYYYMFHRNCALIKTSFGCPYTCNFCFCRKITNYQYFTREVADVINELKAIKENEIYIVDDDFLVNRNRILDFCELLEKEKIFKKYLIYGRADFIANNEDIIIRLKKIGLRAVIVGLETFNDKELSDYNKKSSVLVNELAVKLLKKHDIECYGTFILGIDWCREDFDNLRDWIKKLGIVFVNLQPFTPLKGTELYDKHKDNFIIVEREYEKWDLAHLVIKPTKISVRRYYYYNARLYFQTLMRINNIIYMIRKYGLYDTLKMGIGSYKITLQYLKKIIVGK